MKIAVRERYDSTENNEMHYTIVTVINCTYIQATAIWIALNVWDRKFWGDNENIVPSKRKCESDEGDEYKVVFTIKGFATIEDAHTYRPGVPERLIQATGQTLIDDDQETLDDEKEEKE